MTYIAVIVLVLLSGIFSGLTLGFFSLNKDDLKRKAELGGKDAQKVYKIRQRGNLLLCTLLVGNVAVNSAIAILLNSIASGVAAGFVATGLIVVFGEIIPQATFARYALSLGAKLAWLVRLLIILFFPVCAPIAWLLDKALGDEVPNVYTKKELIKIIEEHEDSKHSAVDEDEEKIVKGALSYSSKLVRDVMTTEDKVFMLDTAATLNKNTLAQIRKKGASRIPVFNKKREQIVGMLYVKDLIDERFHDKPVGVSARKTVHFVNDDKRLDDVLNSFRSTRNHLFVARNAKKEFTGIITIEDVIEEIIGTEIIDEYDQA